MNFKKITLFILLTFSMSQSHAGILSFLNKHDNTVTASAAGIGSAYVVSKCVDICQRNLYRLKMGPVWNLEVLLYDVSLSLGFSASHSTIGSFVKDLVKLGTKISVGILAYKLVKSYLEKNRQENNSVQGKIHKPWNEKNKLD